MLQGGDGFIYKAVTISSSLIASSRKNPIILDALHHMLLEEDCSGCQNMSETANKTITAKLHVINDHDVMRMYQCSETQLMRFYINKQVKKHTAEALEIGMSK